MVSGTYYPNEAAFLGYGTEILIGARIGGGSPDTDTYEAIPYVNRIKPPNSTANVVQKSHLRSPGAHHEKMMGFRDSDAAEIEMTYFPTDPSQSQAGGGTGAFADGGLLAIHRNREERNFIIRLSDGSPATDLPFVGSVTSYTIGEITLEGVVPLTVQITPLRDTMEFLP